MLKKRGKRVVVGGYAANHYSQKIGNRHSECNEESQKNNSNSLLENSARNGKQK